MKKLGLLAAAAAVAALALPATASAEGYLGAAYNSTESGPDGLDTWQGKAAFGHDAGNWGFQVDGSLGSTESTVELDHNAISGHLYWGGDSWRAGAVITTTSLDTPAGDIDEIAYGAEGTFDFGANTVMGWSGTTGQVEIPGTDLDTWNIDASLNHYFTPNFRLGATLGVGNLDGGISGNADTFSAGVGAEFQPFSAPVSFTLGYSHFELDDTGGLDADSWSVGARWNFGGKSAGPGRSYAIQYSHRLFRSLV